MIVVVHQNIGTPFQTQAMKVMLEFGLTAKARTKLPKMDKTDDEESTPLEQFIVTGKKEVR